MSFQQGAIAREWLCLKPRRTLSAPFKTMNRVKIESLKNLFIYSILELFFNSNKVLNLYSRYLKYHTIIGKNFGVS